MKELLTYQYKISPALLSMPNVLQQVKAELSVRVPNHTLAVWGYDCRNDMYTLTYTQEETGYIEVIEVNEKSANKRLIEVMNMSDNKSYGYRISIHKNYERSGFVMARRAVLSGFPL